MFSRPIETVTDTKIFARLTSHGTQYLVYEMKYSSVNENAMILPIPTKSRSEDAVQFIDFSSFERFFEILDAGFPSIPKFSFGCGTESDLDYDSLEVFKVGSYLASFVPTINDFDRLDSQFRLPETTWEKLPAYRNYGFAVFQLQPGSVRPHPMAMEFETSLQSTYFPTVHVHDGKVHAMEEFDHAFYMQHAGFDSQVHEYQGPQHEDASTGWVRSRGNVEAFGWDNDYGGVVARDLLLHRKLLRGLAKNQDTVIPVKGDPETPTFNWHPWLAYSPWLLSGVAVTWFFNRRSRNKKTGRKSEEPVQDGDCR